MLDSTFYRGLATGRACDERGVAKEQARAATTTKRKGMAPKAPGLKTDLPKAKSDGPTPRERLESTRESKGTTKKKDVAEKAPRAEGAFLKETKGDSETSSKAAKSKSSDEPKAAKGDDKRPKTAPSAATSVFAAAGVEPKAAAGVVPPKLARDVSAEITSAVYSIEMTNAVQAAAGAAMEEANRIGLSGEQALRFYNAVQAAAIAVLDPSGDLLQGDEDEQSFKSTVETKLAIAIKKNAVRVMDLFRDWDENSDGVISKKEFRRALKNLSLGGTSSDHDALFDKWDVDGSGALDYNELDKALRTGLKGLKEEDLANDNFIKITLGQGKRDDIAKAKEEKEKMKAKPVDKILSPRSQQLKEAADREAAQKAAEVAERIAKEEESGNIWTATKWIASRGVAKLVAQALKLPNQHQPGEQSHFAYVKSLNRARVEELLNGANLGGAIEFILESIATLAGQSTGNAASLNDKFATTAKFQMTYGSLSLFYGGLESLLGPPKMYKGALVDNDEKTLFNAMAVEHTSEKDSLEMFTAFNGVSTSSELEWRCVVCPKKGEEFPERPGYAENNKLWCRVPTALEEMLKAMEEKCNALLRKDGHSELIKEELVGGRLYTGPMYVKYNLVLRSKSKDPAMVKLARDLTKGNGYVTTIHAINSCVIKLSKLTKAGKVWRGIKGATLPKEFWVANQMGVRGGIEYAFSSTTTDREQALVYSGGGDDSVASTIFEMQMGMVDRGADLTWLSQYPHEREVLLPPLTGIEALGTDVQGSTLLIHSRLSLNLAAHTLDQVLSRRIKMIRDILDGIELEMRDSLGEENVYFGIRLMRKAMNYGPLSNDPDWFNDDENFALVMQQTLYLQRGINVELKRLKEDNPFLSMKGWTMRGPSRMLLLAGWVLNRVESVGGTSGGEAAMCIDLRDAQLDASEAEQLAKLLSRQPRLTSVDVRNNESMGLNGAEYLAKFLEGAACKNVASVPRSLAGVTPANSSLEVPPPEACKDVELRLLSAELMTHVFSEGISAGMGTSKKKGVILNRRGASAADEWKPLIWAAKENHLPIVRMLLDLKADVNERHPITTALSAQTALMYAAQKGHEEMTKYLLDRGADKKLRDKHNNTALMLAEKKQNREIIIMLGGDPDARSHHLE
ncbi:ankyrin repeat protein [Chrysochromulina tobinii]|jgi:hypothetical protein|uniref:Ankyrin repeat protein n=1 Tax=Chrysochromulina tobinii TaxID=1460289 RepID=A0A0M0K4E3_9EUKA|nr:ankyrin repeat protein [Chrysochromulina tobinii]|eukprot:KOO33679.1 ankyrin repeat protein [Chrysochromulina sp. CCMP291]